jgi:hypothetical protein
MFVVALMCSAGVAGAETYQSKFVPADEDSQGSIGFYGGSCTEETMDQCLIAQFDCNDEPLSVTMVKFDNPTLARWFGSGSSDQRLNGSLDLDGTKKTLIPYAMSSSDESGTWDVTFYEDGDAPSWKELAAAKRLTIDAAGKVLTIDMSDENRKDMKQAADQCAAPQE